MRLHPSDPDVRASDNLSAPSPLTPSHAGQGEAFSRYRSLFEHAPLAMWVFEVDSLRIVDVNDEALAQYGYARDEFLTLRVTDLRLPDDVPLDLGQMSPSPDHLLARGEVRHRRKDGSLLYVSVRSQPWDVAGRPARLVVAMDISARRREETRRRVIGQIARELAGARESAQTLERIARLAIAHLADGCAVHLIDPTGALVLLTVACRDAETERRVRDLERRFPASREATRGLRRAITTRKPQLYTTVDPGALGNSSADAEARALWAALALDSAMCLPLLVQGRPLGVITLASLGRGRRFDADDLALADELATHAALALENARLFEAERSARQGADRSRERTEQLQAVTAALSEALTPAEVAEVFCTRGVDAVRGIAGSLSVLTEDGLHLEILASRGYDHDTDVAPFRRMAMADHLPLTDAVRSGAPVWIASAADRARRFPLLAAIWKEGWQRDTLAAVPLVTDRRTIGVVGLSFAPSTACADEDLSFLRTIARQCALALERARLFDAERRARAAMEAARLEAEAANLAKTEFLAVMSHELRTPLNAIAGYTELIAMGIRGPVTDEQVNDLQRIRRSQQHLLSLINDILNFARIEHGSVNYEFTDVSLQRTIADVEPLVSPQLRERTLGLRIEQDSSAPWVRCDRDKLQQVLLNLLSNAIKFTDPGGTITIRTGDEGGWGWIEVADTGIGVPPDRREAIFEPFVQLDQGLTRRAEGTGLGLAISRDLARAMGGDLTVSPWLPNGSCFRITLPRSAEDAATEDASRA